MTAAFMAAASEFSLQSHGYDSPNDATMAAYRKYEKLYYSLSTDQELLGAIYSFDGDYYYTEPVIVDAKPGSHTATFHIPDSHATGAALVGVYHTHPVGGGLRFSGMEGDSGQVWKKDGTPIYLRNERGDVRVLNRENYNIRREGSYICGGAGQSSCLDPHPQSSWKRIQSS